MTQEDIIRMAREAGFPCIGDRPILASGEEAMIRFAALVAAAEREAVIYLLYGIDMTETDDTDGWWETSAGAAFGAERIAAIRARSKT
jgi:hypothetical protein